MSQTLTAPPPFRSERQQFEKLCSSIRGKLQFMDYLVRAAVADVDRFQGESDAGTRIFLRQLIEMIGLKRCTPCHSVKQCVPGELPHPDGVLEGVSRSSYGRPRYASGFWYKSTYCGKSLADTWAYFGLERL